MPFISLSKSSVSIKMTLFLLTSGLAAIRAKRAKNSIVESDRIHFDLDEIKFGISEINS